MTKRWKYGVSALLLVAALATVIGHYLAANSEPFMVARRAVLDSPDVRAVVPDVSDLDLAFFGYFVRYNGPRGEASFEITARGRGKAVKVYTDLERRAGEWQVKQLRIAKNDKSE